MKTYSKQYSRSVLSLCLVMLSLLPFKAHAEESFDISPYRYKVISEEKAQVSISFIRDSPNVYADTVRFLKLPETVEFQGKQYTVTELEKWAFNFADMLEYAELPNTIQKISHASFPVCLKLQTVIIPESVVSIDYEPFWGCPILTDIKVSDENPNFTAENGFLYNKDKSILITAPSVRGDIEIPYGVKETCPAAFGQSYVTSLTIPETMQRIGALDPGPIKIISYALIPPQTYRIEYGDTIENVGLFYNYMANIPIYVPQQSLEIYKRTPDWTFVASEFIPFDSGNDEIPEMSVPSDYDSFEIFPFFFKILSKEEQTVSIRYNMPKSVYLRKSLISVELPESADYGGKTYKITEIGSDAFEDFINLEQVSLPSTIRNFGNYAFRHCGKLQCLDLPAAFEELDVYAFFRCYELKFEVDENNPFFSAEKGVLYNKDKTVLLFYPSANGDVTIPTHVTRVGSDAFHNTLLRTLTIPESVKSFAEYAFYNSGVSTFRFLSSVPPEMEGDPNYFLCYDYEDGLPVRPLKDETDVFLYVPDNAIEAYKSSKWNDIATRILPLSLYAEVEEYPTEDYGLLVIYDLHGRLLYKGTDRNATDTLPAGIYIINGTKTIISNH